MNPPAAAAARAGVFDEHGTPVSLRSLSTEGWADVLSRLRARESSPALLAQVRDGFSWAIYAPGTVRDEIDALPCSEDGADVLVLDRVVRGGESPDVAEDVVLEDDVLLDGRDVPDRVASTFESAAFYGIAGEFVKRVLPFTEADAWALLMSLLSGIGSLIGPGPHDLIGADRHAPRIWVVLVGPTSAGRKGTAFGVVRALLKEVDPKWSEQFAANVGSGEVLIWRVRDKRESVDKNGETVIVDAGADDKRLFVVESEFAGMLRVARREGGILSPILRQAWDGGTLTHTVKRDPAKATDAHVVIVGHVTPDELRHEMSSLDAANGLGNRHMFFEVGRSKLLPRGPAIPKALLDEFAAKLTTLVDYARSVGQVTHSESFWQLYEPRYAELSSPARGMAGALCGRGPAQVRRLALIYCLLDGCSVVDARHGAAALAVWDKASASARSIFGAGTGDSRADLLLDRLGEVEEMSRTDVRDLFSRHEDLDAILLPLIEDGSVIETERSTGGRPAKSYALATKATKATKGGGR